MNQQKDTGIVNIHGKEYKTVARRIQDFREKHPSYGVDTSIITINADEVVIKAVVTDESGRQVGSGIAHERQGSSNINKTSHVENCETSAVGRALASIGLAGSEYASADEVAGAISQQKIMEAAQRLIDHNAAVRDHLDSVYAIKSGITSGELSAASEAWFELSDDLKAALWMAPTKGGIFSTQEREAMQSSEFRQSYFGEDRGESS